MNKNQLEALESCLRVYLPADLSRHMVDRVDRLLRLTEIRNGMRLFFLETASLARDRQYGPLSRRQYYWLVSNRLIGEGFHPSNPTNGQLTGLKGQSPLEADCRLMSYARNGLLRFGLMHAVSLSQMMASVSTDC